MLFKKKAPPDGTPLTDASQLLWNEALRQITRQEADLDTLRTKAVALLSVAALVAGFFGSHIASTGHHPLWVVVAVACALVAFAMNVLAVVKVLMPQKDWAFGEYLTQYFDRLKAGTLAPVDVTANLAEHVQASYKINQEKLEVLYRWFAAACVLVGVQVIAWAIAAL